VDALDLVPRALFTEFRKLPPNHLRIRIGVGNQFFNNQVGYLRQAESFWIFAFAESLCAIDSTIVDIGCGCGRFAHHLRDYRLGTTWFRGRYVGVDVDDEMLDWCRRNFDPERFQFSKATHSSKAYVESTAAAYYTLPVEDATADLVFSTSLLTHLLEPELVNYLNESFRVLKAGGYMCMSCFCLEYPPPTIGGRHTFGHRIGNAYVESLKVPEAAVAYREDALLNFAARSGFETGKLIAEPRGVQSWLLCRKGTA
jgi:ubiquinone/menaquinone biosynthesis C-methylase UbiE